MSATPNIEYNIRFEWTRIEFLTLANGLAERFGYAVRFALVGPVDSKQERRRRWACSHGSEQ